MFDKQLRIDLEGIICKRNTKRKRQIPEQGGKEHALSADKAIDLLASKFYVSEKIADRAGVKAEKKIIHNYST